MVGNSPAGRSTRCVLLLRVCILALAGTSGRTTAQVLTAASAPALTYSNVATEAFLNRAQAVSDALTGASFLPVESFSNATVIVEGHSTLPAGRVFARCCEYEFRDGMLREIRRRDLFEDKGPDSLILRHLTNEVLMLKTELATNRALEVLRLLGYETNRISQDYQITVHDVHMEGSPIRNGGPNFPRDLHFYGELMSREKIKMTVNFTRTDINALTDSRAAGSHPEITLLATTGELLEAWWLPNTEALTSLKFGGPEPIKIPQAADFAPALFFSATRKLTDAEAAATNLEVAPIVREAWSELQLKLGTNRPYSILVCDNLNDPAAIAREMTALAGETPWAGVSRFFRFDLPFERERSEKLAIDKRGIALLAISGPVETRLALITELEERKLPPGPGLGVTTDPEKIKEVLQEQENDRKLNEEVRQRLTPRLDKLLDQLGLPGSFPDHELVPMEGAAVFPSSSLFENELRSRLRGKAMVGTVSSSQPGGGVTYFNGEFFTNGIAVLRLSGFLPLQYNNSAVLAASWARMTNSARHPGPMTEAERLDTLRAGSAQRWISGEATRPIYELTAAFGPNPLESIVTMVGLGTIRLLREADKLEVFEIKSQEIPESPPKGVPTVEGYELVARGKTLGPESAREFADSVLTEQNYAMTSCAWHPVIVFRAWRGEKFVSLVVCFQCTEASFSYLDAAERPTREPLPFQFYGARSTLLRLAKEALPDSSILQGIAH
jgi:hypothetical protein